MGAVSQVYSGPPNTVVTPGTSTVPRQSRYCTGAPVQLEKPAKTTKVVFAFSAYTPYFQFDSDSRIRRTFVSQSRAN